MNQLDQETLIDEIHAFMAEGDAADVDLVSEIAESYSEAVSKVNRRLRKISQLLSAGHVSEAVAIADQSPAVLDQVAWLDFPDRDGWLRFLVQVGVPRPETLRLDLADRLDEAYAAKQNLESLLQKHRLLALTRSPIKNRIMIQRRLCAKAPDNLAWVGDLELLEHIQIWLCRRCFEPQLLECRLVEIKPQLCTLLDALESLQ